MQTADVILLGYLSWLGRNAMPCALYVLAKFFSQGFDSKNVPSPVILKPDM